MRQLVRRSDMQTRIIIETPHGREIIEQRPDATALVSGCSRMTLSPQSIERMALQAMGARGTYGEVISRTVITLEED